MSSARPSRSSIRAIAFWPWDSLKENKVIYSTAHYHQHNHHHLHQRHHQHNHHHLYHQHQQQYVIVVIIIVIIIIIIINIIFMLLIKRNYKIGFNEAYKNAWITLMLLYNVSDRQNNLAHHFCPNKLILAFHSDVSPHLVWCYDCLISLWDRFSVRAKVLIVVWNLRHTIEKSSVALLAFGMKVHDWRCLSSRMLLAVPTTVWREQEH